MQRKRIILANDTHFFRDAFRRVIEKKSDLQVIREVKDLADLPSAVQEIHPDWVIISLPDDGKVTKPVEKLLSQHPYIHILAVDKDGSRIRVEWMEHKEKEAENLSLDDFIKIFESDPFEEKDSAVINP
jgi:DNA-binding NarL/FixJ family response regulator